MSEEQTPDQRLRESIAQLEGSEQAQAVMERVITSDEAMTPRTFVFVDEEGEPRVLPVHVLHVNPRTEKHGDSKVLAVDVKLRMMMGDAGDEWDDIINVLAAGIAPDPVEHIRDELAGKVDALPFSAEYDGYSVAFRSAWADSFPTLAVLTGAKLNKFKLEFDDFGLLMRVQATTDGETIGALAALIGKRVGIVTRVMQADIEDAIAETSSEGDADKQVRIDDVIADITEAVEEPFDDPDNWGDDEDPT